MEVGRILAALYSKLEGIEQEIRLLERFQSGPALAGDANHRRKPDEFRRPDDMHALN